MENSYLKCSQFYGLIYSFRNTREKKKNFEGSLKLGTNFLNQRHGLGAGLSVCLTNGRWGKFEEAVLVT